MFLSPLGPIFMQWAVALCEEFFLTLNTVSVACVKSSSSLTLTTFTHQNFHHFLNSIVNRPFLTTFVPTVFPRTPLLDKNLTFLLHLNFITRYISLLVVQTYSCVGVKN